MTNTSLIIKSNIWKLFLNMGQLKDDILLKKVALRIKALRESKDITQEVFYNDTDIHIGRIELGNQNISISTLSAICKYLEISLEDFFKNMY